MQLDYVLPERFGAHYIGEDGEKHQPVMIHRAIFGSIERLIGVLIEHYAGKLPLWLAPVQCVVATIVSDADDAARAIGEKLQAAGLRHELDLRNEKINYKIREHSHTKVPVMFVLGRREAEEGTVTVRRLGVDKQEVLAIDEAVNRLKEEAAVPGVRV